MRHRTLLYGIYDGDGSFIPGSTDENRGSGSDSHVVFAPASDGTYFVSAGADEGALVYYMEIFAVARYRLAVTDVTDGHPDDDFTADVHTSGAVAVDGTIEGSVDFRGDRDWFSVVLQAGIQYQVDILGWWSWDGSLDDPYLGGIYDSSGSKIAHTSNNDGGYKNNSRLIFSPTSTGTHYISVGGMGNSKGTYVLQVLDNTDRYTADTSTSGTVAVPGAVTGRIEQIGDRDWFSVSLQAGVDYVLDLEGRYRGIRRRQAR